MKLQLLTNQMQMTAAPEPDELLRVLNVVKEQIEKCPQELQQKLNNVALNIEIDIHKYKVMYSEGKERINKITSQQSSKTKADDKHYNQLEAALEAQEQHVSDKSSTNQEIKAAEKERYDFLQETGFTTAKNAKEFQELKAEDDLLLSQENDPVLLQKTPIWIKKVFLSIGKLSAGFATALGIDHIINPEHYEMITIGSFTIGIGLALLMLALTQGSAYRAKEAELKNKDPKKHYVILVGVTITYMIVEAFINYEGIISMSKEWAMESVNSGLLQEAGAQIAESAPTHYSLLLFTLALVGFVAIYSALTGRDQAIRDMQQHKFKVHLAKLRKQAELMKKAAVIDESHFLETRMRPRAKRKPDQAPLTGWHTKAVQHLSKSERNLEQTASQIASELAAEGKRIQDALVALGNDIYQAQGGRGRGPFSPLKLLKLAK